MAGFRRSVVLGALAVVAATASPASARAPADVVLRNG
jgi:hypothetical protein